MTVPWDVLIRSAVDVALGALLVWVAHGYVRFRGWDLPPDDPEAQFKLVQRALDGARRRATRP